MKTTSRLILAAALLAALAGCKCACRDGGGCRCGDGCECAGCPCADGTCVTRAP